jgi:hypothetical protein
MEARKHQGRAAEWDGEPRQTKSRERVRDLAEVYTHQREVHAMLDLAPGMFPSDEDPDNTDRLFLEPACGHGNFLVEILRRKLAYVTPTRYGHGQRVEHRVLRCLASIYGIDVSDDNICETRGRMGTLIREHLERHIGPDEATVGFNDAVKAILKTNVIRADTRTAAAEIELVKYQPVANEAFIREWSRPLDPSVSEPNLFSLDVRRDEVPVHYSELALKTQPVLADPVRRKAA